MSSETASVVSFQVVLIVGEIAFKTCTPSVCYDCMVLSEIETNISKCQSINQSRILRAHNFKRFSLGVISVKLSFVFIFVYLSFVNNEKNNDEIVFCLSHATVISI